MVNKTKKNPCSHRVYVLMQGGEGDIMNQKQKVKFWIMRKMEQNDKTVGRWWV
jgi:hypothetical protein